MNAECRKQSLHGPARRAPAFGVSPAFYLSSHGRAFHARRVLDAIPRAAALGFTALQLEIYRPEAMEEWDKAFRSELRAAFAAEGLRPSQFVAHFLLAGFADAEALRRESFMESYRRVLAIVADLPDCGVVTVPIPPFEPLSLGDPAGWAELRGALVERLGAMLELARAAGIELALELMPFSIVGGIEGFLRLRREAGLGELRWNFDIGHAWARRERVELSPAQLCGAIAGTHLGDHDTRENLKLRPGAGSIDWERVIAALLASGYAGSLDLEIVCAPELVESEYARGKERLEESVALALISGARTASGFPAG